MYVFENANEKWWRKPLVRSEAGAVPAELAILALELRDDEDGAWMNSRSIESGVCGLSREAGAIKTIRKHLPRSVSDFLASAYASENLSKGRPDLVIWNIGAGTFRFVEVKCPLWDRTTPEQDRFMAFAESKGIESIIAEWVFGDGESAA